MKILFLSAEVAPFAKVGGLADVAGSLPKALKALGHDVRIMMPGYGMVLEEPRWRVERVLDTLVVPMNGSVRTASALSVTNALDLPTYLVESEAHFGSIKRSEEVYTPGVEAYIFFAQAAIEACEALDWMPDVVHCNDWHMGFVPVLLREKAGSVWDEAASVFTIHNLAYQGEFPPSVLEMAGLPTSLYNMHQLETFGAVNFLKAGAVYSDQVNTVSPAYAQEIQTAEYGCRLEGLMAHLASHGRLRGILNGIDYQEFDPGHDPRIAENYSASDPSGKAACRIALAEECGFDLAEDTPLLGVVSRLSSQKGMDLMLAAAEQIFALPAQLIVLGTGDPSLAEGFAALEKRFEGNCHFFERFDLDLAQRIYAGSDIFLMPSSFEPCGLGQLIALRYGTIPVVRHTGGLANTVFEHENGFVFHERTAEDMMAALKRAWIAFNGDRWGDLVQMAMRSDHSWARSALRYEEMYQEASTARSQELVAS